MHGDAIRELLGSYYSVLDDRNTYPFTGVFASSTPGSQGVSGGSTNARITSRIMFKASDYAPTGLENSPRTLSVNYWRRVS